MRYIFCVEVWKESRNSVKIWYLLEFSVILWYVNLTQFPIPFSISSQKIPSSSYFFLAFPFPFLKVCENWGNFTILLVFNIVCFPLIESKFSSVFIIRNSTLSQLGTGTSQNKSKFVISSTGYDTTMMRRVPRSNKREILNLFQLETKINQNERRKSRIAWVVRGGIKELNC